MEEKSIEELKEMLKQSEIRNCILEEENSILRESVQCLLIDFKNLKEQINQKEQERREIEKLTSGKIYKILRKTKNITKGICLWKKKD